MGLHYSVKKMLGLFVFGLLILVVFIGSTFGWQGFSRRRRISKDAEALVGRLKDHVKKLSDDIGDRSMFRYEKLREARDYIVSKLKGYGYEVELQSYPLHGKYPENIIADKKGRRAPNEIIIIAAHYDTCFNPGADDNASGVAGLLELARLSFKEETNHTIRFIAFVNEEPPFFKTKDMGSFQYVQELKKKGEDIRGALILEMIGFYNDRLFSQRYPYIFGLFYPNRADFIAVISNFWSRQLAGEVKRNFKSHSGFPIESVTTFSFVPGVDFSDNWSFWKEGLPAVMVTDTAFYRYKYYHSEEDTYEKLDYSRIAEVVYGLSKAVTSMAR